MRSEARNEANAIEDTSEAGPAAPRPTETNPTLAIVPSETLPTLVPSALQNPGSGGARATLLRAIIPNSSFTHHPAGSYDPTPSAPDKKHLGSSNYAVDPSVAYDKKLGWKSTLYSATMLAIRMKKESSDPFPPLKSVVGAFSAILEHCDVWSLSLTPLTHDIYDRPSNL